MSWKWIHKHHQALASYSALACAAAAIVGLVMQAIQQSANDRQIDVLQKSIEEARAHEIAPRLFVELPEEDEIIEAGEGISVRLSNAGKGIAENAFARVHFLRFEGQQPAPQSAIERRTIAPGESVPFRLQFPTPPETREGLAVFGTIGLYCQDEENHEIISTQTVVLRVDGNADARRIVPQLKTPTIHRTNVKPRTSENVRSEQDVASILDYFVAQQHNRILNPAKQH